MRLCAAQSEAIAQELPLWDPSAEMHGRRVPGATLHEGPPAAFAQRLLCLANAGAQAKLVAAERERAGQAKERESDSYIRQLFSRAAAPIVLVLGIVSAAASTFAPLFLVCDRLKGCACSLHTRLVIPEMRAWPAVSADL